MPKKRHFLLLEVLIAFSLIVLCVFPLLAPHAFILRSQALFIKKIELDHLVNLLYGQITENLYFNKIPWKDIEEGTVFPITEEMITDIGFPYPRSYEGTYSLKVAKRKPSKKEDKPDPPYILYVLTLNLAFIPSGTQGAALNYAYDIFVARNLAGINPLPER
ncbi:MAG: hypothetical protein CK425_05335 [Parachlamydia sp.]|nr:MAG: hypothetical protein CK425_05335 [Parachlamydia sp.]